MTPEEFLDFWSGCGFPTSGNPEDAAVYLHEVLLAFDASERDLIGAIGGQDGQQEFVIACLVSMGLLVPRSDIESEKLTDLGRRILAALEEGIATQVFVTDTPMPDQSASILYTMKARAAEAYQRQARFAAQHGPTPEYYRALDALRKMIGE